MFQIELSVTEGNWFGRTWLGIVPGKTVIHGDRYLQSEQCVQDTVCNTSSSLKYICSINLTNKASHVKKNTNFLTSHF